MALLLKLSIFLLLLIHFAVTSTTAFNIFVTCLRTNETVPKEWLTVHQSNPSALRDLAVKLIFENRPPASPSLNISWAINVDGSIHSITGTWIEMNMQDSSPYTLRYKCQYHPPFTSKQANYTGLEQLWFHFTSTDARIEPNSIYTVTAYNLPTPPINAAGQDLKVVEDQAPGCDNEWMKNYSACQRLNEMWDFSVVRMEDEIEVTFKSHSDSKKYEIRLLQGTYTLEFDKVETDGKITTVKRKLKYSGPCENLTVYISPDFEHCEPTCESVKRDVDCEKPPILIIVVGCVLAGLLVFICFCALYVLCGRRGFSKPSFRSAPSGLVGVLIVYPPVDSVFQCAVMALANFLQGCGGLDVAIDMWQRVRVAGQGSLRWLTTQIDRADKVLVVLPPRYSDTGHLNCNPVLADYTVPASAHELYSLALNLVTSSAFDPKLHSKFWVVCLGQGTCLPVELQSCRVFNLPRDLEKLHSKLFSRQGVKRLRIGCGFRLFPSQETSKVREALLHLDRCCVDSSNKMSP